MPLAIEVKTVAIGKDLTRVLYVNEPVDPTNEAFLEKAINTSLFDNFKTIILVLQDRVPLSEAAIKVIIEAEGISRALHYNKAGGVRVVTPDETAPPTISTGDFPQWVMIYRTLEDALIANDPSELEVVPNT